RWPYCNHTATYMAVSITGGVCVADDQDFGQNFVLQAEDGIRDRTVTGVQTCALPIYLSWDLHPAEHPRLKDAVAAFVTQLKSYLPDTEVHMLVGMAPGADLLVVETALDLNVQVEAVLPMSLDQYAADFEPDALQHLKELLRHPRVHCVELRTDARESRDVAPLSSVDARNAMYANLTDTLIRRSSLLLALWDGRPSNLPGGTADTVLRYLGVHTDESQDADALGFVSEVEELGPGTRLVYWA